MPMSTSNIDWAEIQTYFTGSNPVGINEYYAGGNFVNVGQLKNGGGTWPTSGTISASDFSGVYYMWNNSNSTLTMDDANIQYVGNVLRFRHSNGGTDTGSWSNPHCRLLPKWNDTGASGSGVAQNRVCLVETSFVDTFSVEQGPRFEILTPNGQNGTTDQRGNSNWTRLRFVGTGTGDFDLTLNRSAATYTNVGDDYGYTTSSGYSLESWNWPASSANNNGSNGDWTGILYIEK